MHHLAAFCSLVVVLAVPQAALGGDWQRNLASEFDWRFVGPWRGGRVNAVVGHPTETMVFYAGYTGGGVWKTEDGGLRWRNVSDGYFGVGSIGAMDISESHPDVLYVGTGEQALRGDVSHGDGVYRSNDGGETWVHVGLTDTRQIAELIVHPDDPDIVYVAALGHFTGPNTERGVFRTRDGGETWERVLYVDENTGAVALTLDESDPDRLIAGMWEVRRFPWGIRSAGPGSGIYRSSDGGDSWEDISEKPGLPQGISERMDVSISQADPNRVWALMSAEGGRGLYRSDDFGDSWTRISEHPELTGRTYYFQKLAADPADRDVVYVLNWNILVSRDGGVTFDVIESGHADHHAFWIDPSDNRRIIDGSDGGAQITYNGGESWSTLYNQPTGQFYTLTLDDETPFNLYGSQQDWGSVIVPSIARYPQPHAYYDIDWSEAGYIAISNADPNILFISDHHWLIRYDLRNGRIRYVGPRDETNYGVGTRDIRFRFNWTFPVLASQHDRRTVYAGSQYVHRTRDDGETWEILSPDLTRADPDKLEITPGLDGDTSGNAPYWGPLTRDSNGDHWFSTLHTIAESPLTPRVIWTGSDDGRVHVTTNGGRSWRDVTPPGMPDYALVGRVEASPFDDATAFVAASAYRLDDYTPHVFVTRDHGETWEAIAGGFAAHEIVRVVRQDHVDPEILYAGAESGVYLSLDGGQSWFRPASNFPAVPVYDMKVSGDTLAAATHGRGFWAFEHLNDYRQIAEIGMSDEPVLFAPRPAFRRAGRWADGFQQGSGASFHYWLPDDAETLDIEILDAAGELVKRVDADDEGVSLSAGLNTVVWDLRYPNAVVVPGVVTRGNTEVGPFALPGEYLVRLSVDGTVLEEVLALERDPNVDTSFRDLSRQFEFLTTVRDKIDELNGAVIEIRGFMSAIEKLPDASDEALAILSALETVEYALVQPRARYRKDLHAHPVRLNDKLYRLANFVQRGHDAPTEVQVSMRSEFFELVDDVLEGYYELRDVRIAEFNERHPESQIRSTDSIADEG